MCELTAYKHVRDIWSIAPACCTVFIMPNELLPFFRYNCPRLTMCIDQHNTKSKKGAMRMTMHQNYMVQLLNLFLNMKCRSSVISFFCTNNITGSLNLFLNIIFFWHDTLEVVDTWSEPVGVDDKRNYVCPTTNDCPAAAGTVRYCCSVNSYDSIMHVNPEQTTPNASGIVCMLICVIYTGPKELKRRRDRERYSQKRKKLIRDDHKAYKESKKVIQMSMA